MAVVYNYISSYIGQIVVSPDKQNEVIFTLWAESKEEVDTWASEVRNVGGMIFSEPSEFGKGYYGFGFSDPDGHKWNVFHM
jgi:predicted lactoylglutathione lyase